MCLKIVSYLHTKLKADYSTFKNFAPKNWVKKSKPTKRFLLSKYIIIFDIKMRM